MQQDHLDLAVALRHELHAHPELSMGETWTKQRLMDFIREHTKLALVDGGRWFYAVYRAQGIPPEGTPARPNIAFRADFDAVPVGEAPGLVPYASQCPGVGHKCGHDGHSATLAALALELNASGAERNVFLLFQHAEETGQGALECVEFIRQNQIAEIYAYHNLPHLEAGALAVPDGAAQPASKGMILQFNGVKSHASTPEDGRNPAFAIAELVTAIPALIRPERWEGLVLCTVIQVNVGERAFGTSPGYGELLLTIRGEQEREMNALQQELEAMALDLAGEYGLTCAFAFEDAFPETRNHPGAAEKVRRAAEACGVRVKSLPAPFRASEDFGYYTKQITGAIFYLGDGAYAPLHTPGFDFPDGLIPIALGVFRELIRM